MAEKIAHVSYGQRRDVVSMRRVEQLDGVRNYVQHMGMSKEGQNIGPETDKVV